MGFTNQKNCMVVPEISLTCCRHSLEVSVLFAIQLIEEVRNVVFGMSILSLMARGLCTAEGVPHVVVKCVEFLVKKGKSMLCGANLS
jgi:hypothetical protein